MNIIRSQILTLVLCACHLLGAAPGNKDERNEMEIFEMEAFVVYGGIIDTVDGLTGEEYLGSNEVVLGFREKFNELLLKFHRRLVVEEIRHMREHEAYLEEFKEALNPMLESFGIQPIQSDVRNTFNKEKAITQRLINNPFFIIEKLVVWDLDKLERYKEEPIRTKYAKDIRFNPEKGKWERRVITNWVVNIFEPNGRHVEVTKQQGLNLDEQRGFHVVSRSIFRVRPESFEDVRLNYPIFINSTEPAEAQVQRLTDTYLENLSYIYDPYSWVGRRNRRFREPFMKMIRTNVDAANFKVTDQVWLNQVLTSLFHDVATIKTKGTSEIYDLEMLKKIRANQNILGKDLDLLNWDKSENRTVPYELGEQGKLELSFSSGKGARFIVLDAYRRYGDRFLSLLRERLLSSGKKTQARQLVTDVLGEISGIPGEKYIELARQAQRTELEKYRYKM